MGLDSNAPRGVLRLSCPDRMGIVAGVSTFLRDHACNILESAQFGDSQTRRFFMRVSFQPTTCDVAELRGHFAQVAGDFGMWWEIRDMSVRQRVLMMVSRFGHCLNDLLYRAETGSLPVEIPAIVSNHVDFRGLAQWHDIPFHHVPVESGAKAEAEARTLELLGGVDLLVLARYMQVLSADFLERLGAPAINIHHRFLPAFVGADPYRRAHERGVKLIGATAHYVTEELDGGPIIDQDVTRVSHRDEVSDLQRIGRDIERLVLARAVKAHIDDRVLLDGARTIVF